MSLRRDSKQVWLDRPHTSNERDDKNDDDDDDDGDDDGDNDDDDDDGDNDDDDGDNNDDDENFVIIKEKCAVSICQIWCPLMWYHTHYQEPPDSKFCSENEITLEQMIKSNSPDIVFINEVKNITGALGGAVNLGTGLQAGRSRVRLWPPYMQAAILWILAHLVHYHLQTDRRPSLRDYMDFLQRYL